jgi:CoA:oxalate CoA-transferase
MAGPLSGIKVLSFCRMLSGPYASMLLSDLGASVIKIEEPAKGDSARGTGPFIDGVSSYFLSVNRGKKSLTLNLKSEEGREIVYRLAEKVDILTENFRPGVMERLGFDYASISSVNPKIVYGSISGFGQNGPYSQRPAFDMIAQAMGGVVSITGEPGKPPVRVGYSIGDIGASLFSVIGILAALTEAQKSGKGQHIDVGMLDCQVALCENACARYFASGEVPRPLGSRHPLLTPFQIFPTKDDYITLICFRQDDWDTFCRMVNREDWITDARFKDNEARLANYPEFEKVMNDLMRQRTTKQWMDLLDRNGIMCGPVNSIEQVVTDPHVLERRMVEEVVDCKGRKLRVVGTPMKFSRTSCRIEKACPELGEHTERILRDELGLTAGEIEKLYEESVI